MAPLITRRSLLAAASGLLVPTGAFARAPFLNMGSGGAASPVVDFWANAAIGVAPPLSASAAFFANVTTQQVIYTKAPDTVLGSNAAASCAKMMTMVCAVKYCGALLGSNQTVISADLVGGTTAGLSAGDVLQVQYLIGGAHVPSGNDAANALARFVGDYAFSHSLAPSGGLAGCLFLMNAEAALIGMASSTFASVDGFSGGNNVTTARDMARLVYRAYLDPVVQAYSTAFGFPALATYGSYQNFHLAVTSGPHSPAGLDVIAALELLDPTYGLPYTNLYACKGGSNTSTPSYSSAVVWVQPNGDKLVGMVIGDTVHNNRRFSATALIWEAVNQGYTSGGTDVDPNFGSNVFLMGSDSGFLDLSNAAHPITQTSVSLSSTNPIIGSTCFDFNGTSSHMETISASDLLMGSADCTIDFWLRGKSVIPTANSVLFGKWDVASSARSYSALWSSGSGLVGDASTLGSNFASSFSSLVPDDAVYLNGALRHFRLVIFGSVLYSYLDGFRSSVVNSPNLAAALFSNTGTPLRAGARTSGAGTDLPVSAKLNELRVTKGVARSTALKFTPMPIPYARS